ncbi:MAG: hypothetical protein QXI19_02950 [Candidatus Caldarchaeum sp.]
MRSHFVWKVSLASNSLIQRRIAGSRGKLRMTLSDAKKYIGSKVQVEYADRKGLIQKAEGELLDIEFVPMYGSNAIFDFGEIALDKIVRLQAPWEEAA